MSKNGLPTGSIADDVRRQGYAALPRLAPEQSTIDVAIALGELLRHKARAVVEELSPIGVREAGPNTYSGIYGTGVFPLHTGITVTVH